MRDWNRYVRERLSLAEIEGVAEAGIVEEVASQMEECYLEAVAAGASDEEAIRQAEDHIRHWDRLASDIQRNRRALAASKAARRLESVETELRGKGGLWTSIADRMQDLRLAVRRLRGSPGFTFVVLVTLAVGIGANTAIFSVVHAVLLKPLPFDEPDRLVSVWASAPGLGEDILPMSPAVSYTLEDESSVIDEIGLWGLAEITILGEDEPRRVPAVLVTAGIFRALGVQPMLGRRFSDEDGTREGAPTILLGYGYWQSRYGGDPGILGQQLSINGVSREIIGVMPQDFRFFSNDPALFLPFRFNRASLYVGNFQYRCIARLQEGVSVEQATADFDRLLPVSVEKFPGGMTKEALEEAQARSIVRPLKEDVVGDLGEILWVVLGSVGIILVIACANVANLFLVRVESREHELAVRAAIGADRGHMAAQLIIESVLLGLLGGGVGLGLAKLGLRVLVATAPESLPRLEEISLDPAVLLFALGISILSGLLFGLVPIARYWRVNLVGALKEAGRGFSAGRERHRARNALVVVQTALAVVLLIGAGLLMRSFRALQHVDPGFRNPEQVLTLRLSIPSSQVPDAEDAARAHESIARRLEQVPGVDSVGLSTSITMDRGGGFDPIFVEEFPVAEGQMPPIRRFKWAGPGYFETMQNRLVAGRTLTWSDIHDRARVVLVTENLAREIWSDPADAIGKRVGTGYGPGNWREIIGVVGDVRDDGITQPPVAIVYWPMVVDDYWPEVSQNPLFIPRAFTYVIRSSRVGTPDFLTDLREAVWSINGNLPLSNVRTMNDILQGSLARTSFTLVMLAIASAVALLLGTVGIYGVVSYVVGQRKRELGVRITLGATGPRVIRTVLGQGLLLATAGIAIGLGSAYGLTRLMIALLHGVSPTDPLTYAAVAALLLVVALLASYLPARRAAAVDPMVVLRAE